MKNSVIARVVISSFVLDQMAEMSLGSSPHYDQPSCGTYQYDHRGSSCELQNRYWKLGIAKKKRIKGKGWAFFRSQHVNPEAQVLIGPSSSERCILAIGL